MGYIKELICKSDNSSAMTMITDTDITQYLEQMNDEDSSARREAIEALSGVKDGRVLYPLVKALQDEDTGIQQAAMDGLIAYDDEAAVYNVLPLLFDSRVNVRNMAQEILEKIGASGLRLIGLHIKDKDENVRKMIADILGKLNVPEAGSILLEMLNDHNSNVRSSAAEGLGRVGDSTAVSHLITLLNDEAWVAFFAAGALGKIGDSRAIMPLHEFIKSSDVDLQITAIEALGQIGSEEAANALISCIDSIQFDAIKSAIENIIKITHGNIDKVTEKIGKERLTKYIVDIVKHNEFSELIHRFDFIQALSKLNTSDSSTYILKLVSDVDPENIELIDMSVEALRGLKDEDILIHALKNESNTGVMVSLRVLGYIKSLKSVSHIIGIFDYADRDIKIEIISALAGIGGKESLKFLHDMVSFEEGHIRAAAAKGLGLIASPDSTDLLLKRIGQEEYHDVTEEIVNALIVINNSNNIPSISEGFISYLTSEKSFVREIMINALTASGNQNASQYIEGMINDENWRVRKACLEAMCVLNSKGLFDGLIAGVSDEKDEVRMVTAKLAAKYSEDRSVDLLISLLSDRNSRIISKSIEVLVLLNAKKAIPYLAELSNGADTYTGNAAKEAILRISGKK